MSQYPPPPQPDQQHYAPIYPPSSPPISQPDTAQQIAYAYAEHPGHGGAYPPKPEASYGDHLTQGHAYPKQEHEGLDPTASIQIEQRIEQLQHQQSLEADQYHQDSLSDHQQVAQSTEDETKAAKLNRLRKACDSCSIRKVKCDESGPPCKACAALDIPCTFERPSRRRGPPNRHAEAIKRRRDEHGQPQPVPTSPTHAAHALASLSSHPAATTSLSAESILPLDTIDLLINDYFTYIHPLNPFPHEPSFREAWRQREDLHNRPFLALLASMIAALVASFPRKPRQHLNRLKAQRGDKGYPSALALVDSCFKICSIARGAGYLETPNLSVHDAATSYLLGMAATFVFRWRTGRLYLGECMTIIKSLGLDKAKDNTYYHLGALPALYGSSGPDHEGSKEEMLDNITLQVGRRVFWTLFVATRSLAQLGAGWGELSIPPSNQSFPYPPLPLEVEDFCIFPGHIDPQPEGLVPAIAGFNANVRIFLSYQPLIIMEMAWGIDRVVDWERQKQLYHDSLMTSKSIIETLPEELKLKPGLFEAVESQDGPDPLTAFRLKMGLRDASMLGGTESPTHSPEQRRHTQQEIQKANIYATELATRSYIVEKFFSAYEARESHAPHHGSSHHAVVMGMNSRDANQLSPTLVMGRGDFGLGHRYTSHHPNGGHQTEPEILHEMSAEREMIVRSLLTVLSTIDKVNMEPNGDSFAHKIRFIASTLLEVPKERKGVFAIQAEEYLKAFLEILVKLERTKADADATEQVDIERNDEMESRHWGELREYQVRFAQEGGVTGI